VPWGCAACFDNGVEVARLMAPDMLVEIEVDAIVAE
jgi:hypothetical protein